MKVPTYSKFGIKKSEVEKSDSRDRKVSYALNHTLPLYVGIALGLLVYIAYFTKINPSGFLQIITQIFLFATVGVICVGVPVIIFKLTERFYYKFLNTSSDQYQAIKEYKIDREEYDFWKIRQDAAFWNHLDGLSIEKEVMNLFMYQGYEMRNELFDERIIYDHIISKDGKNFYVSFKTIKIFDNTKDAQVLLERMSKSNCVQLFIIATKGVTKNAAEYSLGKPVLFLTLKEIIAMVRDVKVH